MSTQPKALRLADSADACQITIHDLTLVAAELRRLHEMNAELIETLKDLLNDTQHSEHDCQDKKWCPVINARNAIAKATGEQT